MMNRAEFYQQHLDHVSRSFAFCIVQLPSPLKEWVGLSYLLCRVVDTIEDADWEKPEAQFNAFQRFDQALLGEAEFLQGWEKDFPAGLRPAEVSLLQDAAVLMQDYQNLPPAVHKAMQETILTMSEGMQHFARTRSQGKLVLRDLGEVNQYCFFVAGVVGELLTKLLAEVDSQVKPSPELFLNAHHFGLFLQKVNLLKDQVGDEKVGRHLIPAREPVENSARENAAHAFEFLKSLPKAQIEFRRFCAWSLFLGLEALLVSRASQAQDQVLSVARPRTEELLGEVEEALSDEARLENLFDQMQKALGWKPEPSKELRKESIPAWLLQLYRGPVQSQILQQLGMVSV